jgi:hypothetical protein
VASDSAPDGVAAEHDFGGGWSDDLYGPDGDSRLHRDLDTGASGGDGGVEANAFDVEPDDVAADDDLDFTGDGHVDGADLHEALFGFHDFHVDPHDVTHGADHDAGHDPGHGAGHDPAFDPAHDAGHGHGLDPAHVHHDDPGLFG